MEEKTSTEPVPGTSKEVMAETNSSSEEEVEEIDPKLITDEFLQKYVTEMPPNLPMTISEEMFYTNQMVQKEYEKMSEEDKQ